MTSSATPIVTEEHRRQLREIIREILELEDDELTDTSLFIEDHEADSLLAIEILARIEQDLGVSIPQEELPEMVNFRSVHEVFARNLANNGQ
ncbi:acyl carrier protein [Streptomyces sulphureus]|uniref:acyl carrier protein n=1 Tax=Streptomyces sulphureus TaxID=47758 RepID=UPI0003744993|nr:acyl carrier protein [Streptomyces sulphureus]